MARFLDRRTALAGVLFLGFLALGLAFYSGAFQARPRATLRISGGPPGGTYDALARGLGEVLARALAPLEVGVLQSAGSRENVERLERGECDLAFVQNDTQGAPSARALAVLYEEVLHLLVDPALPLTGVEELAGRSVSLGPAGSGTEALALSVLECFALRPDEIRARSMSPEESLAALADPNQDLDAAFLLSALPSEAVIQACDAGHARLVSLGRADLPAGSGVVDAIATAHPFYRAARIPVRMYGEHPRQPLATISVTALLAAPEGLEADLAQDVTELLFARRADLARSHPVALRFRERHSPDEVQLPFHAGALAHYLRDDPPLVVAYAEVIGLVVSFAAALFSLLFAWAARMRQRDKDRIDEYYKKLESVAARIQAESVPLLDLRAELYSIRHEAFERLINEKVQANESFLIFQNYLRALLDEIDTRRVE